jgi:hypothetical protein
MKVDLGRGAVLFTLWLLQALESLEASHRALHALGWCSRCPADGVRLSMERRG